MRIRGSFTQALGHQSNHDSRNRLRNDRVRLQRKQSGPRAPGRHLSRLPTARAAPDGARAKGRRAAGPSAEGSAPPAGTTPRRAGRQGGSIRTSGFPRSTLLPSDPSYQPWAKKIYDERKANKGKDDPERICLPDGAVRDQSAARIRSCRAPTWWCCCGREIRTATGDFSWTAALITSTLNPRARLGNPSADGMAIPSWSTRWASTTRPGWTPTGKPHSEAMHLTERYRRPDLGHLERSTHHRGRKGPDQAVHVHPSLHARAELGTARVCLPGNPGRD